MYIKLFFIIIYCQYYAIYCYEVKNSGQHGEDSKSGEISPDNETDYLNLIKNISLRNCYCDKNQLWKNGKCVNFDTSIDVILSVTPNFLIKPVNTKLLDNIIIENVTCNENNPTPFVISDVAFYLDNSLFHFHSGIKFEEYCLMHVLNPDGNIVTQASVCLRPLKLPVCCRKNQALDSKTLGCQEKSDFTQFYPPVSLSSKTIDNADIETYYSPFPNCEFRQYKTYIVSEGKDSEVTLEYQNADIILFLWQNFHDLRMPEVTWTSNDYCLAREFLPETLVPRYMAVTWEEWGPLRCDNTTNFSSVIEESIKSCEKIMYWVLLPLLVISTVFLFIIIALHALMAELRKSLGSKITLSHVASLAVGFCILLILHIPQDYVCKVYGDYYS